MVLSRKEYVQILQEVLDREMAQLAEVQAAAIMQSHMDRERVLGPELERLKRFHREQIARLRQAIKKAEAPEDEGPQGQGLA